MKTATSHTILIIEPDVQFREELYNFLLAAGYKQVTATDSVTTVLESIRRAAYDVSSRPLEHPELAAYKSLKT